MAAGKKSTKKKKSCEQYRARGQREKNKKLRLIKHTTKFPKDLVAANHKLLKA
jgi:hypothetical protein